ncbi:MAG TPA: signal peptidase I [Nitrososphaerales archaeon]|nr:signal peptidase I [Nitrososphaerales archaeon]
MRIPANASKAIFYVLIILFIVVAGQLVVGSAFGSSPVYVVVSSSMVPTLEVGDLVITQSVPFDSIQVGQVIIYQQPTGSGTCPNPSGETIVHRVVTVTPQGLITQGDNRVSNPVPDEPGRWPPITAECLNGKVILAVPYLGLISMVIPPPFNYILVILILVFVYLSESRPEGKDVSGGGQQGSLSYALAKTRDGQTLSHKP